MACGPFFDPAQADGRETAEQRPIHASIRPLSKISRGNGAKACQ